MRACMCLVVHRVVLCNSDAGTVMCDNRPAITATSEDTNQFSGTFWASTQEMQEHLKHPHPPAVSVSGGMMAPTMQQHGSALLSSNRQMRNNQKAPHAGPEAAQSCTRGCPGRTPATNDAMKTGPTPPGRTPTTNRFQQQRTNNEHVSGF